MKLLGPVVDVHKQKIVQQQVLDEIVLVIPFFISGNQRLDLKGRQLRSDIHVIRASVRDQNILQLHLIVHLEELESGDHLALRR